MRIVVYLIVVNRVGADIKIEAATIILPNTSLVRRSFSDLDTWNTCRVIASSANITMMKFFL